LGPPFSCLSFVLRINFFRTSGPPPPPRHCNPGAFFSSSFFAHVFSRRPFFRRLSPLSICLPRRWFSFAFCCVCIFHLLPPISPLDFQSRFSLLFPFPPQSSPTFVISGASPIHFTGAVGHFRCWSPSVRDYLLSRFPPGRTTFNYDLAHSRRRFTTFFPTVFFFSTGLNSSSDFFPLQRWTILCRISLLSPFFL